MFEKYFDRVSTRNQIDGSVGREQKSSIVQNTNNLQPGEM